MKVAVLSRHFSRLAGGAESYAVQLAEAMLDEHDITVVSQTFDATDGRFKHIRVPTLPIRNRWINQLWFNWYTQRVTASGFEVVHSHENVSHGAIHTVHVKTMHASLRQKGVGTFRRWSSPRLLAYLWLEKKRLCGAGHHLVFVSQLLFDETKDVLASLSPGRFIPPGVKLPDTATSVAQKQALRRSLGLDAATLTLGFVGHDFKKKGLDTLLQAVARLPFDVQLVVVGKTDHVPKYADLVEQLGPGKKCLFLGVVRDMASVYGAIDCLAHPTTQDVFPMVMLEAMAHHVPVVTTMAPYNSMASLLTHHANAMLVPTPGDEVALGAALNQVLTDVALRTRLISGGRTFAEKYSWTEVTKRYKVAFEAARTSLHP